MLVEMDDERMERERLEALVRAQDAGDLPFEVKKCPICKQLRAVPKGRENCAQCRHPLGPGDMQRMNVPEEFWRVTLPGATESVQDALRNFITHFTEFMAQGAGLYLWGKPGRGKTGAAVALLKAARERFKTGFFIRVGDLRDAIKHQNDYDADQTVMSRVREVEMLIIDSFTEADLALPYLKLDDMMDLIAARGQRQKVTLLTTTIPPLVVGKKAPFFETVGTYLVPVEVEGENRRQPLVDALTEKMLAKKPESKTETKTNKRGK